MNNDNKKENECDDPIIVLRCNDIEFKDGDPICVIDIVISRALVDVSGNVCRDKIKELGFGRIGHNKNQAIDLIIEQLIQLKEHRDAIEKRR